MALSCFLLLRVAVSSKSRLQLLPLLCWNAINRWGFRKTHHFFHCSHEWMLYTFWFFVKCRHIFPFYYLSHLLRKDKPCALIPAVLTCSGLQVSPALCSPHRCFLSSLCPSAPAAGSGLRPLTTPVSHPSHPPSLLSLLHNSQSTETSAPCHSSDTLLCIKHGNNKC